MPERFVFDDCRGVPCAHSCSGMIVIRGMTPSICACPHHVVVVDVEWVVDHESLKSGVVADGTHRCSVFVNDEHEAELVAAQLVAAVGFMPTQTTVVI